MGNKIAYWRRTSSNIEEELALATTLKNILEIGAFKGTFFYGLCTLLRLKSF